MVDLWHQPNDIKGCIPGITCAKYSKNLLSFPLLFLDKSITVIFFLLFVIIMTFVMLNLFMLVLV